jgi:serine/threonine protein kinase/uncharacterized protein (DUF342 family)
MLSQDVSTFPSLAHYVFEAEVGVGGMGKVYRARDARNDTIVAIKVLHSASLSAQDSADVQARFVQEAQLAMGFDHPNLVRVFDVFAVDGHYYLVMEYVSGSSLKTFLSGRLIRSGQHVIPLMIQACQGLAYAHQRGIIHRDIKPDNLFVTEDEVLKIMDFGIARQNTAEQFLTQTQPGMMLGTLNYMSPEQLQDTANVDPRSDIFSLGVVMYELFTGRQPFARESMGQTMLHILSESPEPPEQINPRLSPELVSIIMCCLAKRRGQRYQNMEELATALSVLQEDTGLPQPTVSAKADVTGQVRSDATQPTPLNYQDYLSDEQQSQLPKNFYHRASGLSLRCEASGLKAFLSGDATYATETLNRGHIERLLAEANICIGVRQEALDSLVGQSLFHDVLIAEGILSRAPQDARVAFLWDEPMPGPVEQADGSVNHRELNQVPSVEQGEAIARLYRAVPGTPGQTIYGEALTVSEPKQFVLKEGPGTHLDPDDPDVLLASLSGLPVRLHQGAKVVNVLTLDAVNLSTGNIDFDGAVVINGPVEKGFKVRARGDIVVFGPVEGAEIHTENNLYLHKPVYGGSQLSARYHIKGFFFQGAEIDSGGDTCAYQGVLHCQVRATGRVILGPTGSINGGEVYSAYGIYAHTIGSHAGHQTRVAVGRNPRTQWELENLQARQQILNQRLQSNIKDMLYARTHQQQERLAGLETDRTALLFQVNTLNDEVRFFEAQLKRSEKPEQCVIYAQKLGGDVHANLCGTGRHFVDEVDGPLRLRQKLVGLREHAVDLSFEATIPALWDTDFLPQNTL